MRTYGNNNAGGTVPGSYKTSLMDHISKSAQARQRAFSQTPTLQEDENAGYNYRKNVHDKSSELLDDTTYNSQGEDLLDSTSNGTNHKQRRHRRNISSSGLSAHAVAGGFNIGNYMQ